MGFWDDFGHRGDDIWWESTSVFRIARFQTSLVKIWRAVQLHSVWIKPFAIGKNLSKFGSPQLPYQKSQKTPLPEGAPMNLRLSQGKIGIILRCNPWAVGWSPESAFYGFCMGKIGQNPKIGQIWRPVAPQPYVVETSSSAVAKRPRDASCLSIRQPPVLLQI